MNLPRTAVPEPAVLERAAAVEFLLALTTKQKIAGGRSMGGTRQGALERTM